MQETTNDATLNVSSQKFGNVASRLKALAKN